MAKKATLANLNKMKKQIEQAKPMPLKALKAKAPEKKRAIPTKDAVQTQSLEEVQQETATVEGHIPRGQRADFVKTTVTLPIELLAELRVFGLKRRAKKMKDTDFSALTREAITEFLITHKDD
jgi:hypothetical protein